MELIKDQWTNEDIPAYLGHLETYRRIEKEAWTRNILNTKLDLLAMPTKVIHDIVKKISKGNYLSYLDLKLFTSYEAIAIYGILVTRIKDFDVMLKYLNIYLDVMENWAHVDILSLPITQDNKDRFIELSNQYVLDQRTFVRRLSLMILFQMVKDESILPVIYSHIRKLKDEQEYYVIMMAGWLLSECVIQHKDQTLKFLLDPGLNKKIVNKAIQKCRESRRFTQDEKDHLLTFKR